MVDERTAIRHPKRGKAHRLTVGTWPTGPYTSCARRAIAMAEQVPLSQAAPEDRCRKCWPTLKETP